MTDSAAPRWSSSYAVRVALGAMTVLVLLLGVWAASAGPDEPFGAGGPTRDRPTEVVEPTETETPLLAGDPDRTENPPRKQGWVTAVIGLTVLAIAVGVGLGLLYLLGSGLWRARQVRWEREHPAQAEPPLDPVRAVVAVMVADADDHEDLLLGGSPRNAVVECWHRFETQAERAGLGREPWETSSEFTLRLLDLVEADAASVARLSGLYREARFSDHELDEDARDVALETLRAIHRDLRSLLSGGRL